jgi:hypothetical protein
MFKIDVKIKAETFKNAQSSQEEERAWDMQWRTQDLAGRVVAIQAGYVHPTEPRRRRELPLLHVIYVGPNCCRRVLAGLHAPPTGMRNNLPVLPMDKIEYHVDGLF